MDMDLQEQVAFRLTGQAAGSGLRAVESVGFRPALLAGYRDLTSLRYDFPLVLLRNGPEEDFVRSLSGVIDALLQEVTPRGAEGERLRKHVLRLEKEIRAQTARGVVGSLSALWEKAARRLVALADESVQGSLDSARAALKIDGKLLDCNASMAPRLFTHAWTRVQQKKARTMLAQIDSLVVKLSDILKASAIGSEEGRSAESLRASIGATHEPVFDFDVMSRLLARIGAGSSLPASRLRRIQWALSVLKSQLFFAREGEPAKTGGGSEPYVFVFEDCAAVRQAFRERLPGMAELVKAIAVARLEVEGRYIDTKHDAFFEAFDGRALDPEDLALFPDYLVCLRLGPANAGGESSLWELLSSGVPAKVLVQHDDILAASADGDAALAFSARSAHLAAMAIGLREVYVLQSASSNLLQVRKAIVRGFECPGPALFSVYSASAAVSGEIPPYLNAAAAMQSRAFPAFCYNPGAGPDWASRFSLEQNPEADSDWTAQRLVYEDEAHQSVAENVAFTFVDFIACDPRYAAHFAKVGRAAWNERMVPVADYLSGGMQSSDERVAYVLLVDHNDVLHRVIVDDRLIRAAHRCRDMWHGLQELGGIHNSHAERLLAQEKKAWEEQKQRELEALKTESRRAEPGSAPSAAPSLASATAAPATSSAAPVPAEPAPEEKSRDEAYIETPRCTSCDECTQISNTLFAYDANKQAYIANLDAGTYRQLVEAAESCQVSIIHPGKPRNPAEPGLDELLQRAEPFL